MPGTAETAVTSIDMEVLAANDWFGRQQRAAVLRPDARCLEIGAGADVTSTGPAAGPRPGDGSGRDVTAASAGPASRELVPEPLRDIPMVIDTDIGGDPDDAVALALAARHVPQLALVITCDEHDGQRARFARHLLDLLGRPDVPVVAGHELAADKRLFCVEDLTPASTPAQDGDPVTATAEVVTAADGPVRWVGLGPMSNLAALAAAHPGLVSRLRVTQMGGALRYRDPSRATRNIRRDVAAAKAALHAIDDLWLVTSDVTFTPETEIHADSPVYWQLAHPQAPDWAQLLHVHFERWFTRHHPGSRQHDPLTLSLALGLPFVDVNPDRVAFDDLGRMRRDHGGIEVFRSVRADYRGFRRWLAGLLHPHAFVADLAQLRANR